MNTFVRRPYAKSLQHIISPLITPIIKRRGIAQASIILDWEKIVQDLSDVCWPMKLRFAREKNTEGLLYLWVKSGTAIRLEYSQDIIIARINGFFGYKAVSALKFIQTTFEAPHKQIIKQVKVAFVTPFAESDFNDIESDKLKQALCNFGNALSNRF